ncbi:MAG: RNA 2',3'-cyclic phosphodiesterase [Propionibacteriaceae bacterium]|jgi:2'-5' RNA ligase|nr:RNA 2',3'-cyclic phosphodiesterase [Propionibacteriaceae bacterium]
MRLFIALPPDTGIRLALEAVRQQLRAQSVTARYSPPDNWHLTLAFVGETPRVGAAERALAEAVAAAPTAVAVTLRGFGNFRGHRGDTLWVGAADDPGLTALAGAVADALRDHGFDIPKAKFLPHLTIARQAQAAGAVWVDVPAQTMRPDRAVLYRSDSVDGRRLYTELASAAL